MLDIGFSMFPDIASHFCSVGVEEARQLKKERERRIKRRKKEEKEDQENEGEEEYQGREQETLHS